MTMIFRRGMLGRVDWLRYASVPSNFKNGTHASAMSDKCMNVDPFGVAAYEEEAATALLQGDLR
jgi:hypothetical protein